MEVQSDFNILLKYFNSVCRVCLTEAEPLIAIDEINFTLNLNSESCEKTVSLVTVFHKYCNVRVHEGDDKPQKICEACMNALCNAYTIFALFSESNNVLDSLLYKYRIRKMDKEKSLLNLNRNRLPDSSLPGMKQIISKDNENNAVASIDHLNKKSSEKRIECEDNIIALHESNHSEANRKALNLTFDTDFLNVDNDPSDEPQIKYSPGYELCTNSGNNTEDVVFEIEPKRRLKIPPFYIVDPRGLLRDHTYSMSERTFLRLLCKKKRRRSKRPPRPKKPKKEKPQISESNRKKLQRLQDIEDHIYKCRFCETDLQGMDNVMGHLQEKHPSTKSCILCLEEFDKYNYVIYHMTSHAKLGLVCRRCHLFFKDQKSLELHKESALHSDLFTCKICEKKFVARNRLKIHMDGVHAQNAKCKYQCSECGILLKWRHNLYRHMLTHQDVAARRKFLCQFCAKCFVSSYTLTFHVRRVHEGHTNLRYKKLGKSAPPSEGFQCEICAKLFKFENSFFKHRLAHPEATIDCPYCDRVLENPKAYKEHRRLDHSPFVCDICQRGYPTKGQLLHHKGTYHLEKTYRCPQCEATFDKYPNYKYHELTHSGRRPYKCDYCWKSFRQQAHRTQHVFCMHTQKKFSCKTCGKRFMFDSSLKDHMRSHTGERPFICPYCTRIFRDTTIRHKHVKHDHPDRMEEFLIYKKENQENEVKQAKSYKMKDVIEDTELKGKTDQ